MYHLVLNNNNYNKNNNNTKEGNNSNNSNIENYSILEQYQSIGMYYKDIKNIRIYSGYISKLIYHNNNYINIEITLYNLNNYIQLAGYYNKNFSRDLFK